MTRTAVAKQSPIAKSDNTKTGQSFSPTAQANGVIGITLTMGWQLAVIVLVPVFGGHVLDDHLNTAPVLTLVGLVMAIVGMIVVVRHALQELNRYMEAVLPKTDKTEDKE